MIVYYTFVVFLAGFLAGLVGALWYTRRGKYMGTVIAVTESSVYVDNYGA